MAFREQPGYSALTYLVTGGYDALILFGFVLFVLNSVLIWTARDATARGMNDLLWMLLVLVLGPLGFAIYLYARRQGRKAPCRRCANERLEGTFRCPWCGIHI